MLPSGKHTENYGKSPFFMGKPTIYIKKQIEYLQCGARLR